MGAGATEHKNKLLYCNSIFEKIKSKFNLIQEKYNEMKANISIIEDINNREKSLSLNDRYYKDDKLNYIDKKIDSLIENIDQQNIIMKKK